MRVCVFSFCKKYHYHVFCLHIRCDSLAQIQTVLVFGNCQHQTDFSQVHVLSSDSTQTSLDADNLSKLSFHLADEQSIRGFAVVQQKNTFSALQKWSIVFDQHEQIVNVANPQQEHAIQSPVSVF